MSDEQKRKYDELWAELTPKGRALCDQVEAAERACWADTKKRLEGKGYSPDLLEIAREYFKLGFWNGRLTKGGFGP